MAKEKVKGFSEETKYKDNHMIVLRRTEEDRFPFQFGLNKAELILLNLPAIEAFVAKHKPARDKAKAERDGEETKGEAKDKKKEKK